MNQKIPDITVYDPLQNILSFLPGTYATSLFRNHSLNGPFREMLRLNIPVDVIDELKKAFDCKISFFDNNVTISTMYIILISSINYYFYHNE